MMSQLPHLKNSSSGWLARIDGAVVILIALLYAVLSLQIDGSVFIENRTGARTFPLIIALMLGICGLILFLRKDSVDHRKVWPDSNFWRKTSITIVILFVYAYTLSFLGFVVMTTLVNLYIAHSLSEKKRWVSLIVASLLISLSIQLLFSVILELNLPLGTLWESIIGSVIYSQ